MGPIFFVGPISFEFWGSNCFGGHLFLFWGPTFFGGSNYFILFGGPTFYNFGGLRPPKIGHDPKKLCHDQKN